MTSNAYQLLEIVGTSSMGLNGAIENGVAQIAETVDHITWFEVNQIGGHVRDGKIDYYQVALKVGHSI